MMLWYIAGLYLFGVGFLLFLDDGDIFIGFLWVIDFGVGLIFFIFILHFSVFLHQKAVFTLQLKFFNSLMLLFLFLFLFFYIYSMPSTFLFYKYFFKVWYFLISWYDYYCLYSVYNSTDLNLLREIYFYNNSFEFFLINFLLFYGIISAITLCFIIRKIFLFLVINEFFTMIVKKTVNINFFIRNQNFINQQNTNTGVRVWSKRML